MLSRIASLKGAAGVGVAISWATRGAYLKGFRIRPIRPSPQPPQRGPTTWGRLRGRFRVAASKSSDETAEGQQSMGGCQGQAAPAEASPADGSVAIPFPRKKGNPFSKRKSKSFHRRNGNTCQEEREMCNGPNGLHSSPWLWKRVLGMPFMLLSMH